MIGYKINAVLCALVTLSSLICFHTLASSSLEMMLCLIVTILSIIFTGRYLNLIEKQYKKK
jgi:hypothetical protein